MGNFLMGFGIGLAAGVLFAPKSGAETRDYISNRASEGTDYLVQQGQQLRDKASDLMEQGKSAVMASKETLTNAAQSGIRAAQQAYNR